jgi:hypothetical protein
VLFRSQIEQITGYSVKPGGLRSEFKHGGIVVYEKNGHGLVVAITDIVEEKDWNGAKQACEELVLNGYSDWRLPTKEELERIRISLADRRIAHLWHGGGEWYYYYWSSSPNTPSNPSNPYENLLASNPNEKRKETYWAIEFANSRADSCDEKTAKHSVRAVRSF